MGRRPETMQGTSDPLEDDPGRSRDGNEVDDDDELGSPVGRPIASCSLLCGWEVWNGAKGPRSSPPSSVDVSVDV